MTANQGPTTMMSPAFTAWLEAYEASEPTGPPPKHSSPNNSDALSTRLGTSSVTAERTNRETDWQD